MSGYQRHVASPAVSTAKTAATAAPVPATALRPVPVPKLLVGRADDPAERVADATAETALARLHRVAIRIDGDESLRRSPTRSVPPAAAVGRAGGPLDHGTSTRITDQIGSGQALPPPVRARMQNAFGVDLSGIRVHDDPEADRLNAAVSAQAFTVGRDIFFAAGRYRPTDSTGEGILAHELAHVVTETPADAPIRRAILVKNFRGTKVAYIEDADKAWNTWLGVPQSKEYAKVTKDDITAAFLAINPATGELTFESKDAFGIRVVEELGKLTAVDLTRTVKATPTVAKAANPIRPVGTTEIILQAALDDTTGADTGPVDLTRDELIAVNQNARGRVLKYVADAAGGIWKKNIAQAKKPIPLTLKMIRDAQAEYANDDTIDKSRELDPRTQDAKILATERLRGLIPTIHDQDPAAFRLVDALRNERVTTELTEQLGQQVTTAFIMLDRYWMELKPKSRDAIRDMVKNAKEFGSMRGLVGEAQAAWYAAAVGRTDVGVTNDKLFDPTSTSTEKPRPGLESQDVDVTSNTPTERFYTEAKYDMGTFLKKASETVTQAEEAAAKGYQTQLKDRDDRVKAVQATGVTIDPPMPRALPPRATDPVVMASPAQLHRYEKVAQRPKATPLKRPRAKRLEIYLAQTTDWLALFSGHAALRKHLQDKGWRVVVATHDVMADAAVIADRFVALRKALLSAKDPSSARIDLDPWRKALSAALTPGEFVKLPENELEQKSREAFAAANS